MCITTRRSKMSLCWPWNGMTIASSTSLQDQLMVPDQITINGICDHFLTATVILCPLVFPRHSGHRIQCLIWPTPAVISLSASVLSINVVQGTDMQPQVVPPERHYFAFSIDVAATLELYCDGGNVSMLQKLDGVKNRMYAGYCGSL